METFESLVEVKHGATTLVAIGAPMWAPVEINGQQAVQAAQYLRASGSKAIPRGNESNVLTFSLCNETASVELAAKALLAFPLALPRTMADVTVKFADNSGVKIKNATVQGWGGKQVEQLGNHTVTILGGKLEVITP